MTVLVLLYKADYTSRRMLEGFRLEADRAGWSVQVMEYAATPGGGYSFLRAHGGSDIPSLLDFWRPDGCIVECEGSVEVVPLDAFSDVPAVFVDRSPADSWPEGVCLVCDNAAVVAIRASCKLHASEHPCENVVVEDCHAHGPCEYVFRGSLPRQAKRDGLWDPATVPGRHSMATFLLHYCDYTMPVRHQPGNIVVRNCAVENAARPAAAHYRVRVLRGFV